jgi:hypothetical protein
VETIGGPPLLEKFKRNVLPNLTPNPEWNRELSEAEYQFGLAKMREELPYYLRYLLDYNGPPPPASWLRED